MARSKRRRNRRTPAHLDATEKQIWAELVHNAPQGVLTAPDRIILALACQLEAKARTRTISDAQRNQLTKILSHFGFTSADRSRRPPQHAPAPNYTNREPMD